MYKILRHGQCIHLRKIWENEWPKKIILLSIINKATHRKTISGGEVKDKH